MTERDLGDFMRSRREALRPGDVGLVAGTRRRTPGLRREEVALLANVSVDYYERLEQSRGSRPSEALLADLARALRLSVDERDYLYHLAGYPAPATTPNGYVEPSLMFLLAALTTVPAHVIDDLTNVLAQNRLSLTLIGPWAKTRDRYAPTSPGDDSPIPNLGHSTFRKNGKPSDVDTPLTFEPPAPDASATRRPES